MIFFDYLYYTCCKIYQKTGAGKEDWGNSLAGGSVVLFLLSIVAFMHAFLGVDLMTPHTQSEFVLVLLTAYALSFAFFLIRYNKYVTYKDIYLRVEQFSKRKKLILDILVVSFLIISFPLLVFFVLYYVYTK